MLIRLLKWQKLPSSRQSLLCRLRRRAESHHTKTRPIYGKILGVYCVLNSKLNCASIGYIFLLNISFILMLFHRTFPLRQQRHERDPTLPYVNVTMPSFPRIEVVLSKTNQSAPCGICLQGLFSRLPQLLTD